MSNRTLKNFNLNELTTKWQQLQDTPNVFSYRLNVKESKFLPGKHRFYAELNPERTSLRRAPQTILSLDHPFEDEKFNFKKINPAECFMKIPIGNDDTTHISMIVNKSPLTPYHTLICPNVEHGLKQRITLEALRFCVQFLLAIENNQHFRIGYNSPGALASVNHLHLHLMFLEKDLYIDQADLTLLGDQADTYRLAAAMPTEAVCFVINHADPAQVQENKIARLYHFLIWLCNENIPHNLFLTPERLVDKGQNLKIFVFARAEYCFVRDLNTYNIGFCELAGFITVGSQDLYASLTEKDVVRKINAETGDVFSKIYNYFNTK